MHVGTRRYPTRLSFALSFVAYFPNVARMLCLDDVHTARLKKSIWICQPQLQRWQPVRRDVLAFLLHNDTYFVHSCRY